MRHDSERVRGKNYRPLGGRPLFHHVIATLLECPSISEVVIDTDSQAIVDGARKSFPTVRILIRPNHLRDGAIPMNEVLRNDVEQVAGDVYVQTHSTNPFLSAKTIESALDRFSHSRLHDSLFGVTRLQTRLWRADGTPLNHDPGRLIRTQDMDPIFEENSCIYLFTRDILERTGSRIGERPILFEVSRTEAWDIDTEADFEIAEAIYRARTEA